MFQPIPPQIDRIASRVLDAAFAVHTELGPGLLESIYESGLAVEMSEMGLSFERQKTLPVVYKGQKLDADLRMDVLVEDSVIVEIKSVDELLPVH